MGMGALPHGALVQLCHPVVRPEATGMKVAAAMLPVPATQFALMQISAPEGTLPNPTALPPEFKYADEGTNSYSKPAPARSTVFWLPKISQAKPARGDQSR